MKLSKFTIENLIEFLKEILTEERLRDYFERMICEGNFKAYENFFLHLNSFEGCDKQLNELFRLSLLFLLYNENINLFIVPLETASPSDDAHLKEILISDVLPMLFQELEIFNTDLVDSSNYPNKLFIRDYIFQHFYQTEGKMSYKDLDNLENNLESIYGEKTYFYLSRYFKDNSDVSVVDSDIPLYSAILNKEERSSHYKYLEKLIEEVENHSELKKTIYFQDGDPEVVSFNSSNIIDSPEEAINLVSLSKKISSLTINYKI